MFDVENYSLLYMKNQQCHISKILEISNISHRSYVISWEEMWVWVRGMCISKGDDTSPVANDHVSRREMSYLPREMRHVSTGDVGDLQNFGSVTLLNNRYRMKYPRVWDTG
jgi:hypothetical protein